MKLTVVQSPKFLGFSLVEICLALSIFAFSLVTIMALFPLAIKTSDESLSTGRIAEIGNSILAELRAASFSNTALMTEAEPCRVDLSAESDAFLLLNEEGARVRAATSADFFTGSKGQEAYVVRLRTRPISTIRPRSASITLDVERPVNAPSSSRIRETFVTIVRERQ